MQGIKLNDETSSQDFEDNYQPKTDLLKARLQLGQLQLTILGLLQIRYINTLFHLW
jgi:hypothetical protein